MLAGGVVLLGWAVSRGEAELYLFLIFPVVSGTGPIFAAGTLLLIVGVLATFMALSVRGAGATAWEPVEAPPRTEAPQQAPQGGVEFGGVVFIGPIPIVFGRGHQMGRWMLVASIVFAILLMVFILGLFL